MLQKFLISVTFIGAFGDAGLSCDQFKSKYQSYECCDKINNKFDTSSSCSADGVSTRLYMQCDEAYLLYKAKCCDSQTPNICNEVYVYDTCIVGGGIGGMGVALGLNESGKLSSTLVIERGLDVEYLASQATSTLGALYPHMGVAATTPVTDNWAGDVTAFTDVSYLSTNYIYLMAIASNTMGGLHYVNGGGWGASPLAASFEEMSYIRSGIEDCTSHLGYRPHPLRGNDTVFVTQMKTHADSMIATNVKYAGYKTSIEMVQSDYNSVVGQRVHIVDKLKHNGLQYMTGKTVHDITKASGTLTVRDSDTTPIAHCNNVVLAAGYRDTQKIIEQSDLLGDSHTDFTGYHDSYGALFILFPGPQVETVPDYTENFAIYGPTGQCQSFASCYGSQGFCYFAVYTSRADKTTTVGYKDADYRNGQYDSNVKQECLDVAYITAQSIMDVMGLTALNATRLGADASTPLVDASAVTSDLEYAWDNGQVVGVYHGGGNTQHIVHPENSTTPFKLKPTNGVQHNIWIADNSASANGYAAAGPTPKICAMGIKVGRDILQ
jgi:hypothetical protein